MKFETCDMCKRMFQPNGTGWCNRCGGVMTRHGRTPPPGLPKIEPETRKRWEIAKEQQTAASDGVAPDAKTLRPTQN